MKDYYFILDIETTANETQIKTAYRKLALKFHPDKNQGDKLYEERFKVIQEAYETLMNTDKRHEYDIKFRTEKPIKKRDIKAEQETVKRYGEELRKKEEEIKIKYKTSAQKTEEEEEIKRKLEFEKRKEEEGKKILSEIEKHNAECREIENSISGSKGEIEDFEKEISAFNIIKGKSQEEIDKLNEEMKKLNVAINKLYEEVHVLDTEVFKVKFKINFENEKIIKEESDLLLIKKNINALDMKFIALNNMEEVEEPITERHFERAGELLEGGIIIYTEGNGGHGLLCTADDLGKTIWADAKKTCDDYKGGGRTDWRLPSKEELELIYRVLYKEKGIKNFATKNYWSSTLSKTNASWVFDFHSGDAYDFYNKYNAYFVRAVRAF